MIGETVSHYRIVSKLGEGGMGTVYVAEDTLLGRRVAIKSLKVPDSAGPKQFRARFLREARAASILNHPHIATIHDYGETDEGQPYLVMELIEGQSLTDLLRENLLPLQRTIEIVKQVAEAIAEAHRHGIVHRDIKPSNVMLNHRHEVKVLDFGLAKQLPLDPTSSDQSATQTLEGVVLGTPSYLSPEQVQGMPVDGRSDIFAIGALLYECLTGARAFSGKTIGEIFAQVIRDDPSLPSRLNPHVPQELDRITLKALSKTREDRYQTAEQLLEDLSSVESAPVSRRRSWRTAIARVATRREFRIAASIVAALTVVALISVAWRAIRRSHAPAPPAEAVRLYNSGTDALRNGSYLKATGLFEQAIRIEPRFPLAHARLAETWMELDYEERATSEMLRVTELAPDLSSLPPRDMLYLQAIGAAVRRNFQGAIENLEEIVKRSPEAEKPSAYFDLGRAYERAANSNKAIEAFEEVTRRDAQSAAAFLHLAILYARKQEAEKTAAAFQKAQTLYETANNTEGMAEVFYQAGASFNNVDKLSEAQEQFSRAYDLALTADNKPQQIKTLLQLGSVLYSHGETNRAEQYTSQAMQLAAAEQLDNLTTAGLVEIGNAFFLRGEYDTAEKYFQQSLQIAKANKGRRGEARASLSLGSLFVQRGNGGAALKYLEPALAFYRGGHFSRETLQALLLIGYANEQQGNNDTALASFNEQLQLAQQVNDFAQVAHTHAAIGLLLLHQERFTEALDHFDQSYKLNQSLGLEPKIGYDLLGRGDILWRLGHYQQASEALDRAFEVASRAGGVDKQLLGWIDLFRAEVALSELRYSEALTQSRKAAALGGTQDKDFSVQVGVTQCLSQLNTGMSRAGIAQCQQAFDTATRAGNPRVIASAQLALSEALLASGDAANALAMALPAQQSFARLGSRHSEWRAWLIAAQASRRQAQPAKVDEYATHAAGLLTALERTWGADEYNSYLSRPDVRRDRKALDELLPGVNN